MPIICVFVILAACADGIERTTITVGGHRFAVEIADTPEEREQGLMFREALDADHGMVFIFPDERPRSFWMRNTPLPLSIAYIDAQGIILEIHDMEPFSLEPVRSRFPARYALEVNRGRFRELGIEPGDRVDLSALPER